MTRRKRTIAEEETPLAIHQTPPDSEEIKRALERIEELEFWVNERRKQL
jgi:hypothetical protein